MKISKFQFGNKVPKPSEDFIKQKLGYGATSTIGTQSQRVQQNQAAQQAQSRADSIKYLKALKEGQNWAINKSVQNRATHPGSIKALPKDYKIEDGHIPTQDEINKENELRQDLIKGIGLRNKEDWENNRSPIKAILKSGVLYANPYTGALNAGYNLANPETGVSATYNNFKNGNYLQGAVSGAFNLLDAGMMGNGVNKIAQKLIPSYDLYSAIKNGTVQSEKLSPKVLYRANVYKGGEIKNPRYSFFTTDEKYASQYGKVKPYIFESKNIAVAKEPLMGAKNPVNQDMMIYENTKNNPSANAIIGYDKVTGEFPYQSHGTEILNLDPNNIFPLKTDDSKIIDFNRNNKFLDNIVGKNSFDFSKRFSSTEMPRRLQVDPSQTFSMYKEPISLDYVVNESLPSKFKKERFTDRDLSLNYEEGETPSIEQLAFGFDNLESSKRWKSLNDMKQAAENVGIKNPSLIGQVNADRKYQGMLISGDNVKERNIDLNSPQMKLMREQYAQLHPEEYQNTARYLFDENIKDLPPIKRYFTYTDSDAGIGGYFDPNSRTAVINLRNNYDAPTARSTFIHEVNSHGTDDFFKNTMVQKQYENVLKDLGSNLPWYELRATLNEIKNKITSVGSLSQLKEKLDLMSDNAFMNRLNNINGYGRDLVNHFDKFNDGSFVRPDLVKRLKWASATLPAATPVIINKGNSE